MVESLIEEAKKHFNEEEIEFIIKAYNYAFKAHDGQLRKSGEPYIIHPVSVSLILMQKFHLYNLNSVVAALLHDTIEDTDTTYQYLDSIFGRDVANLVLGVTDSSNVTFKTKTEEERYNNTAILRNMANDFRIIYIKLADRFHNMSTLEYQRADKRYTKAVQTLAFYVPFAYGIGARRPARTIEDYCFQYINPEEYQKILKLRDDYDQQNQEYIFKILAQIEGLLSSKGIKAVIYKRIKNVIGIYNSLLQDKRLQDISDLVYLQIVLKSREECFEVFRLLKDNFSYDEATLRNYITKPKYSGFRGLVLRLNGLDVPFKIEIYTRDMEELNLYGYAVLANKLKDKSIESIQHIITSGSNFMGSIIELSEYYRDNKLLMNQVEAELFNKTIRVYTPENDEVMLPEGSSILDFAYRIHSHLGDSAVGAYVNGDLVNLGFQLQDGDVVEVLRDYNIKRSLQEVRNVKTTKARRMIEKAIKKI